MYSGFTSFQWVTRRYLRVKPEENDFTLPKTTANNWINKKGDKSWALSMMNIFYKQGCYWMIETNKTVCITTLKRLQSTTAFGPTVRHSAHSHIHYSHRDSHCQSVTHKEVNKQNELCVGQNKTSCGVAFLALLTNSRCQTQLGISDR